MAAAVTGFRGRRRRENRTVWVVSRPDWENLTPRSSVCPRPTPRVSLAPMLDRKQIQPLGTCRFTDQRRAAEDQR